MLSQGHDCLQDMDKSYVSIIHIHLTPHHAMDSIAESCVHASNHSRISDM